MIDRLVFMLLLGVLAIVPLPFASVHPWTWGVLVVVSGVLLLGWSLAVWSGASVTARSRPSTAMLTIFVAVFLWTLFQIAPFSPARWHHPLWIEASQALSLDLPGSIALVPDKAFGAILRFCSYATIFWLSFQYCRDPKRAKTLIFVIAVSSACYAAYGLIEHFSGTMTILWYRKTAYWDDLTSTFVNKNNYATYAGLGWLCTLALLYRSFSLSLEGVKLGSEKLRYAIAYIEKSGWRYILMVFLLIGALLYSHSRAGLAATILGILVFCLALSVNKSTDKKFIRRFGIGAFILALVLFAAGGQTMDARLAGTDLSIEERPKVYQRTMTAIGDQPFLGSGLGSFEEIFRFYRTPDIHEVFDYAHNSYLEGALELGIPATALIVGSILVCAAMAGRGARIRRRDEIYSCLGLAVTTLVGLHSLLDFSIQIPAVAITYSGILGASLAQSWSSRTPPAAGMARRSASEDAGQPSNVG